MNTENYTSKDYNFKDIFELQKELLFKYEPDIEQVISQFDINTYSDQQVFKDFCWRITEELMEALEDRNNVNHFREELIDGLNFLIELYLLYGWDYKDVDIYVPGLNPPNNNIEKQMLKVIYQLGITANVLKNRPWRSSQYMVDLLIFENRFKELWFHYMRIFSLVGLESEEVRKLWSLKYQVNKFRIDTKY